MKYKNKKILIFAITLFVLIAFSTLGAYIISQSKAGTNPYSNGALYTSYERYDTPNATGASIGYIDTALKIALPNDCNSSVSTSGRTWNIQKKLASCFIYNADGSYTTTRIAINNDNTSPMVLMRHTKSPASITSTTDVNYHSVISESIIKDGSMSKIAFIEARGTGTSTASRIGIYDTGTQSSSFLKDAAGGEYVSSTQLNAIDWSPDGTKLYYLLSIWRNGSYVWDVCNIAVSGGNPSCIIARGAPAPFPSYPNSAIWSYDLSEMYFLSSDQTSSTILAYSAVENNFQNVVSGNTYKYLAIDALSPDGKFLVVNTQPFNDSSAPWAPYIIDTVTNQQTSTSLKYDGVGITWQALKTGSTTTTVPPNSGPTAPSDLNKDSKVDVLDLSILLTEWSR